MAPRGVDERRAAVARNPGPGAGTSLTAAERAELPRHRCFVTCTRPGDDLWPYGLRLTESA